MDPAGNRSLYRAGFVSVEQRWQRPQETQGRRAYRASDRRILHRMPWTTSHQEIEIKLRVRELDSLRATLKRLRAREISPRIHESDTLFDSPGHDLRRRGRLIRIRTERAAPLPGQPGGNRGSQGASGAILTYKGPAVLSNKRKNPGRLRGRYKIKEEAELQITNADEMAAILGALGLRPAFRYEKYRTTYALPGVRALKIELDETPVGIFLELEGEPAAIDRAARLLGYAQKDYLTDSYGALYLADCRRSGRKPGNMLFPATKKLRDHAVFP